MTDSAMAIPSSQTKHMLLSVTGMSPAVVTETLYGIAQRIKAGKAGAHWPDEIRIITTSEGKKKLLTPAVWQGGEKNNVFKRIREVCELEGYDPIPLDESHILIVPDANGKPVEDAREIEDHEALANFITSTVRDFTSGDHWCIHASIAGGRKTMTFYLGYAMSLFGRHFDCMSHVLVDKDFEGGDFFFPYQKDDDSYNVKVGKKDLDSRDATVKLTDIPFIRMRQNLPAILKEGVGSGDTLNYRTLVNLINLGDQPDNIRLRLTPEAGLVELFEGKPKPEDKPVADFKLDNPVYMAIYTAMARVTKQSDKQRCRYVRTANKDDDNSALYLETALELARVAGMFNSKQVREVKRAQEDKQAPQKELDLRKRALETVQASIKQAQKEKEALEKKLSRSNQKVLRATKAHKKQELKAAIVDIEQKLKAIQADIEHAQKDTLAPSEELERSRAELQEYIKRSKLPGKVLFAELAGRITNDNDMLANLKDNRTASIVGADLTSQISEIRQKIEGSITEQLKYYLIPSSIFNEKGVNTARGKYYGLRLNPEQIEIIE